MSVLLSVLSGSRAYGTHNQDSDYDIRGVFVPSSYERTLNKGVVPVKTVDIGNTGFVSDDVAYYDIMHFMTLCAEQSPVVLDILWTPSSCILSSSPEWEILLSYRHSMLSRQIARKSLGFAKATQARLTLQPMSKPRQRDYVTVKCWYDTAPVKSLSSPHIYCTRLAQTVLIVWVPTAREEGDDTLFLVSIPKGGYVVGECAYHSNRFMNDKRCYAALSRRNHDDVNPSSYDTKQAAQLIRILRSGRDILTKGYVPVLRPDVDELRAIRAGEYALNDILSMAETERAALIGAEHSSPLPETVNPALVAMVVDEVQQKSWSKHHVVPPYKTGWVGDSLYYVVDIECCPNPRGQARIVDIAAVEMRGGMRTGRIYHSYVRCSWDDTLEHKVTRLTPEFLKGMPSFPDVYKRFRAFIGDSPLMMFDSNSDRVFLENETSVFGLDMLSNPILCAKKLTETLYHKRKAGLSQMKLGELLGLKKDANAHTALGDAEYLARCLEILHATDGVDKAGENIQYIPSISREHLKADFAYDVAEKCLTITVDGQAHSLTLDVPENARLRLRKKAVLVMPIDNDTPSNPLGFSVVLWTPNGLRGIH